MLNLVSMVKKKLFAFSSITTIVLIFKHYTYVGTEFDFYVEHIINKHQQKKMLEVLLAWLTTLVIFFKRLKSNTNKTV